jgi:hypothetical protein
MKRISYKAAVTALKSIFQDVRVDSLTPLEIYKLQSRSLDEPEKNKKWLQNRLTPLKDYGFVRPIYTKTQPKSLDKIKLTDEGKKALEGLGDDISTRKISLESIARDIKDFEKQNPSIEVIFSTKIRKELDI